MAKGPVGAPWDGESADMVVSTALLAQPAGEIGRVTWCYQEDGGARISVSCGRSGFHVRPSTILLPRLAQLCRAYDLEICIDTGNGAEEIGGPIDMLARDLREGVAFDFVVSGARSSEAIPDIVRAIDSLNDHGGNRPILIRESLN